MTREETAEVPGVSVRVVKRDWVQMRTWLRAVANARALSDHIPVGSHRAARLHRGNGCRVHALESGSNLSRLREHTQSALPLSERLTGLKFGVNPEVTDARILPWMGAGMVSLTMGSNLVLGGDIDLPCGPVFLTLAGSTIHVDDRVVVENGVLKP